MLRRSGRESTEVILRFLGPGAFRLILAALVVCSHLTQIEVGRVAVMGFFVLSGYWVALTYIRNYAGSVEGLARFYAARFFRIYPFYLVMLCITLAVNQHFGDVRPLLRSDLTLFGLANEPALSVALRPAWSLDVELQFYLLLPPIIWLIGRIGKAGSQLALAFSVAATAAWWVFARDALGLSFLAYAAPFVIGVAAALKPVIVPPKVAYISAGAFVLTGLLMVAAPPLRGLILKNAPDLIDRDIVAMAWVALLLPFILRNVRVRSVGLDRRYGDLAFSLYLTHWMFAKHYQEMFGFVHSKILMLALTGMVIVGCSLIAYIFIDLPIEKVRRRYLEIRRKPIAAA